MDSWLLLLSWPAVYPPKTLSWLSSTQTRWNPFKGKAQMILSPLLPMNGNSKFNQGGPLQIPHLRWSSKETTAELLFPKKKPMRFSWEKDIITCWSLQKRGAGRWSLRSAPAWRKQRISDSVNMPVRPLIMFSSVWFFGIKGFTISVVSALKSPINFFGHELLIALLLFLLYFIRGFVSQKTGISVLIVRKWPYMDVF